MSLRQQPWTNHCSQPEIVKQGVPHIFSCFWVVSFLHLILSLPCSFFCAESVREAVGRKVKLSLRRRVKLEIKGDRTENRVLVSRLPRCSRASSPPGMLKPSSSPCPTFPCVWKVHLLFRDSRTSVTLPQCWMLEFCRNFKGMSSNLMCWCFFICTSNSDVLESAEGKCQTSFYWLWLACNRMVVLNWISDLTWTLLESLTSMLGRSTWINSLFNSVSGSWVPFLCFLYRLYMLKEWKILRLSGCVRVQLCSQELHCICWRNIGIKWTSWIPKCVHGSQIDLWLE